MIVNFTKELYLKRSIKVKSLFSLFLWHSNAAFCRSYSFNFYPLFAFDILFREFRRLSLPFANVNSGVYSIHSFVKSKIKKLKTVMIAKLYFQSLIIHDINAIKKTPKAKLICKKIIILCPNLSITSSLIKE